MSVLPTQYTEEACREAAKEAKLRYVKDTEPGITRKKRGRGFIYFSPQSERITAKPIIARINALAIPPAYRSVWICPLENGHLQATGRDERRRKQYRYHPKWEEMRNQAKFQQMGDFAESLPIIRAQIEKDSALPGLPKERVLATLVQLMDTCHIRVGNAQYANENKTYGLTTLQKEHVNVEGSRINFEFIGKSGKKWKVDIKNRRIANTIKRCEELPGQELFHYIAEDGSRHGVSSEDVNTYLQEISGKPITAKDFRTWAATAQAIELLVKEPLAGSETAIKKQVNAAIKTIAAALGHTPAICRKCYVHPKVLEHFSSGELHNWHGKQKAVDDHTLVSAFLALA